MKRPNLDPWIMGWRGPVLAALIAMLAGLPSLMLLHPLDRDESRFAQATTQMIETGDYIDIRFQDEARHKKPVGIYWMQAASVQLLSSPEARDIWAFRIPSLLGAMLAAFACAWGGAALFGARAGFLAGAMLGTTFLLSTEAGIAKTDAMLAGTVTLALAALGRLYVARARGAAVAGHLKFVFWIALALSILIKGPIGALVVILTVLALCLWDRQWRWLGELKPGWGLVILAVILAPWAVAVSVATDGAFWREAIMGDLAPKVVGGHEGHWGPPGQYLLLAPLLLFPMTLMVPAAVMAGITRRAEPAIRFALCWLVPSWLMFELAPTKLWHYTLPTFGAIALLAAAALTQPIGRWSVRTGVGLSAFAALLVTAITLYGLSEFGTSTAQTWASFTIGLALVGAAASGYLLVNRMAVTAVVTALVFGVLSHAALSGVIRQLKPLWVSPRLEQALETTRLHPRAGFLPGPVAIAGYHEPSFVFLTGTRTELTDGAGAARAIRMGRPAIVEAREEDAFRAALAGLDALAVGESVEGRNYSNGDEVSLRLYRPASASLPESPAGQEDRR